MAGIKISVDDIRAIPDGYDLLFLNPENFISWRKDNPEITISELSLDHDMGLDYMDGYDLVKYMVHEDSMNIGSIERIQFHTDNMIGLKNMYCYLESAKKHGAIGKEIIVEKEKINLIDGKLSYSGYSFGGYNV